MADPTTGGAGSGGAEQDVMQNQCVTCSSVDDLGKGYFGPPASLPPYPPIQFRNRIICRGIQPHFMSSAVPRDILDAHSM